MTATRTAPTVRERLEQLIHGTPGRGVTLDFLCEQLADSSRETVRNSLKYLVKLGLVMRHGSIRFPVYQSLRPNGLISTDRPARKALPGTARVTWPDHVQVQRTPAHRGGQWAGTDWTGTTSRTGCQDHLAVPSRRGDMRIPHRGAMGMRQSSKA